MPEYTGAASRRYPVGIASVRLAVLAGVNGACAGLGGKGGAGFWVMGEDVDIRDRESLEAWLEDQPREVAVWIASRAAARALPIWWQAVLIEDWARKRDLAALPVLRCLLKTVVFAKMSKNDLAMAATQAFAAAKAMDSISDSGSAIALAATINAAASASRSVDTDAAVANAAAQSAKIMHSASTGAAVVVAAEAAWTAVETDAKNSLDGVLPNSIPLWSIQAHPLKPEWKGIRRRVQSQSDAADWQFWIEWYDALLDGRPMLGDAGRTWEMLERIALIDPATWDRGPEVVNPVIREIWELHRLRAEVAALQAEKAAVLAVRASEAQRGHNQPHEGLVDDAPEVARQITIIWDGLDEAREELERDAPDKGRLRAIAERMLAALNAVVAYCGKVADKTVTSAAEAAGKLAGRAAVVAAIDQVANNGRLMQFAKDLLAFGGG